MVGKLWPTSSNHSFHIQHSIMTVQICFVPNLVCFLDIWDCRDFPDWVDNTGASCDGYTTQPGCRASNTWAVNGVSAKLACCFCGGGVNPTLPPTSNPTLEPSQLSDTTATSHQSTLHPTSNPTLEPSNISHQLTTQTTGSHLFHEDSIFIFTFFYPQFHLLALRCFK